MIHEIDHILYLQKNSKLFSDNFNFNENFMPI